MKVLLLNTFEKKGGAAVACKRLALALQKQGVEVAMLVRDKNSSDLFVSSVVDSTFNRWHSKFAFLSERLKIFLINHLHKKNLFTISIASTGFNISNHPLVKEADIIHIHWINQGFLSIHGIDQLIRTGKPIVWTMHDMWPVTGICHYASQCHHYTEKCGKCPFLQKPSGKDLSFRVLRHKSKVIAGAGINFVACSHWLLEQAEKSVLKTGNIFSSIPNPIDTTLFVPGNQELARTFMHLPTGKKIILFGADIASDKRKGVEYLIQATHFLADLKEEVELAFCGEVKEEMANAFGLKTHALGYLSDTNSIIKMYQAADCFVIPSLEENLPNMVMEAMSCGVPCVGFHTGGIPEMITHLKNGYIAEYQSATDLAFGIRTILAKSNDELYRNGVREFVLANYTERIVTEQYIQLYQKVLS